MGIQWKNSDQTPEGLIVFKPYKTLLTKESRIAVTQLAILR
jgi:hypothetical protein